MLTDCRKHHKGADVLRFFKLIDLHVAPEFDVHVVLDNLSAHKAPEVKKWLADPKRARWHLHFIPTSSSWLNLVERWFKELTDRRLRRGVFNSVPALIDAIETWVEHWNDDPKPFLWHKTAEEIVAKVRRGRAALAEVKSANAGLGGLVVAHVLSSRVRRTEWAREDERRFTQREYAKRLEFLVDVQFVGRQGEEWILELLAFVHNKGLVDHTITRFDFDLRCLRHGEPMVDGGDEIGGQVLFPHLLKRGEWLPSTWSGTFIEPGPSTKYSYLTSIPPARHSFSCTARSIMATGETILLRESPWCRLHRHCGLGPPVNKTGKVLNVGGG